MKENFSMLINFNLEKLDKLLYDFYRLTGLTISIWDSDFNQLAFQPKNMQSFCRVIKETKIGKQRCLLSDKKLCMECKESGKPVTHRCHAGLIDTAVPIKFKDTVLGYIIFGQVTDSASSEESADIARLATDLKIDSDTLKNLYSELDSYDSDRIESAANILKMSARYLWLSEYIDVGYDSVASEIDKFIKEKLTYMIIENDDSNIIATTIYNYILVMKANNNTMQLGELKMHLSSLAETLNKTFEQFKDIMEEESKGMMQ